jgi:hypothetical protein
MTKADQVALQSKGFYVARQDGRLLSNEGNMTVYTSDGVNFTLRFGEVLYGSGMAVSAGADGSGKGDQQSGQAANRYLFVTAEFNDKYFNRPSQPASTDFKNKADSLWTDADRANKQQSDQYQAWEGRVAESRALTSRLNARFADWFYVISEESFKALHLSKAELRSSGS